MPKTAMIRARIEPQLKTTAEKALKDMGFTATEAITIFYKQIVIQKRIPFEVRLERDDVPEKYIRVKSDKHLNELLGIKNAPNKPASGCNKSNYQSSTKNKTKKS